MYTMRDLLFVAKGLSLEDSEPIDLKNHGRGGPGNNSNRILIGYDLVSIPGSYEPGEQPKRDNWTPLLFADDSGLVEPRPLCSYQEVADNDCALDSIRLNSEAYAENKDRRLASYAALCSDRNATKSRFGDRFTDCFGQTYPYLDNATCFNTRQNAYSHMHDLRERLRLDVIHGRLLDDESGFVMSRRSRLSGLHDDFIFRTRHAGARLPAFKKTNTPEPVISNPALANLPHYCSNCSHQ